MQQLLQKLAIATRRDPETRENAARLFREAEAAKPEAVKNEPAFLIESAETLIAQGQTNRGAAARLFISEATVKTHLVRGLARLRDLMEEHR